MIIVESERLIVRELTLEDLPAIIQMNADRRITKYIRGGKHLSEEEEAQLLEKRVRAYRKANGLGVWAICLKKDLQLIGIVSLMLLEKDELHHGKIHLGFRIGVEFWKKGYAREVGRTMINYAFNTLRLKKISAFSDKENEASIAVLTDLGFEKLGETLIYGYSGEEYVLNLFD